MMMKTAAGFLLFFAIVCTGNAQTVLYTADFGTGTAFPTGWSVTGTQAANIEISTATPSNIYNFPISFSAGSNLNDGRTGAANGTAIITVSGVVNTVGYTSVQVLFGARETANYSGTFLFEWSSDGVVWNPIAFTNVANNSTWQLINAGNWLTLPAGASNQPNLQFRLTMNRTGGGNGNYSIDDFTVQGFATGGSNATDYFRSRQSGNWHLSSSWESSPDNSTWINATLIPTVSANIIQIRNGHSITMNGNVIADQLIVDAGATLLHPNSTAFTIDNGPGDDMSVSGTYVLNGANPLGLGTYVVENGGIIRADNNTGGVADNIAMSSNGRVLFKTGSIFQWNNTSQFSANGFTYFNSATERPVFRITQGIGLAVGGGADLLINGLFEADGSISFTGAGSKIFRDGIIGAAIITQTPSSGTFIINGTNAQLGGFGSILLNNSGLQITAGAQVLLTSNKTVDNSSFINNGTFNCQSFIVSGTTAFTLNAGATLGIGSSDGITSAGAGNIQTSSRTYSSDANYLYNGATNQVTGVFTTTPVANSINALSIANTGNVVTLSTNNLTTNSLYLNSGFFASGTNQTLRITANGIIYGNGGHNQNNAAAGFIEFLGNGSTNGIAPGFPNLYAVIANGAIDFNGNPNTQSATIMNRLQLNNGSSVSAAPFYATGSTLVYNTGFTYARNVEWGSAPGVQGYPYHVTVQGNTILDLNTNPVATAQLALGGDLTVGTANGWGRIYMNAGMARPLSIGGSLIIGSGSAASNSSELFLSNNIGGDLWLYGSFTRYNNCFFTDNNRAVYLRGSNNASINTPDINTPGIPSQNFSYVRLEKTGNATITLNCATGITRELSFISGFTQSNSNNLLVFYNDAVALSASATSFNNGPVKKIGNDAFVFPVGKPQLAGPAGGGYRFMSISAPALTSDSYTAEFIVGSATGLGPIGAAAYALGLKRVSRCEYWTLNRDNGNSAVDVTISWNDRSSCNGTYVTDLSTLAVAHFDAVSGTWDLFGGQGNTNPLSTVVAGSITWPGVTAFSPFSIASTDFLENPLPLTLSSFTARARKDDVQLDWHVMNNIDQDEYILERSGDGRLFHEFKKVPAKVILNQAAYTELDKKPLFGWNYYRLRAVDKQDREKLSDVVKVWFGTDELIRISPNPASEKIVINLSQPSSILQIELVNIAGQVLQKWSRTQFTTEINISHLQAGMYYLRIQGKNGLSTKCFVKN
ncbi:MAG: T9SS type A sorting domain-containing protein [Chitinophagaceae bacterium]|nr:T9SS type A sorting domain-containing protein [Chitinophagaceae bacterium]